MVCWLRWFINRFLAGEIFFLDCEAKKLAVGYVTSNEFVHATPNALGKNSVVILASQQGNTAETVEAARIARQKGAATIGLVYTPRHAAVRTQRLHY